MKLTDDKFWDSYWKKVQVPSRIDLTFSFDRCLKKTFSRFLTADPNAKLIEIGCTPSRWLVHFYEKYRYQVSGIDNSEIGVRKTQDNLRYHNIDGKIYRADLLKFHPPKRYDVVLSLGFIEHFEEVDKVIEKHLSLLKPGGKLILGIPNFRGINFLIQKYMYADLLAKHNLRIMNRGFFENLPQRFPLEKIFVGYVGGFEPALFWAPKPNFLSRVILKALGALGLLRRNRLFDNLNFRLFSSYITGIFKYRDEKG
jgi:SAM-dependent methyltransferase